MKILPFVRESTQHSPKRARTRAHARAHTHTHTHTHALCRSLLVAWEHLLRQQRPGKIKGKDMQVILTKPVNALVHKMWCTKGSGPVTLLGTCGPCRGWL